MATVSEVAGFLGVDRDKVKRWTKEFAEVSRYRTTREYYVGNYPRSCSSGVSLICRHGRSALPWLLAT
jgi:hypothetical protein